MNVRVEDASKLAKAGSDLASEATAYQSTIELLYGYVGELEKVWTGNEATTYIKGIKDYETIFKNFGTSLSQFGQAVQAAGEYYGKK